MSGGKREIGGVAWVTGFPAGVGGWEGMDAVGAIVDLGVEGALGEFICCRGAGGVVWLVVGRMTLAGGDDAGSTGSAVGSPASAVGASAADDATISTACLGEDPGADMAE